MLKPAAAISYTYDRGGNRLTMTDGTGTTRYAPDNLDRMATLTYPDGRTIRATYDDADNRRTLTNPGGVVYTYNYDNAGQLTSLVVQGTRTWTFAYDPAGLTQTVTAPNSTSTAYTYLTNNWPATLVHRNPSGTAFQSFSWTYDNNGNRVSQTDQTGTTSFVYDKINRLTSAVYPAGFGTWSWSYDEVGNRRSQTAPSGTTNYTYDNNNRLTRVGTVNYSYDQNGNLTGKSNGETFVYDPFNQLTRATTAAGTVNYTYNGDGVQVRRTGPNNAVTNYYSDGIFPIYETNSAGTMVNQLDRLGAAVLGQTAGNGTRHYFHTDGLGSTTALSANNGAVSSTLAYDAWGNTQSGSITQTKYLYTGAEKDQTNGLIHMGARFYDPTVGRFINEDPAGQGMNVYAYVSNNPMNETDSTGLVEDGSGSDPDPGSSDPPAGWDDPFSSGDPETDARNALAMQAWNGGKNPNASSQYASARDIARALSAMGINREMSYSVAGRFLDKIMSGISSDEAIKQTLTEMRAVASTSAMGAYRPPSFDQQVQLWQSLAQRARALHYRNIFIPWGQARRDEEWKFLFAQAESYTFNDLMYHGGFAWNRLSQRDQSIIELLHLPHPPTRYQMPPGVPPGTPAA